MKVEGPSGKVLTSPSCLPFYHSKECEGEGGEVKTCFQVAFCSIGAWKWVASTAHVSFPHLSDVESVQKSSSKSDWVDSLIMKSITEATKYFIDVHE